MKRIIALLLAFAMCFSFCGCGAVNETTELINAIGEVTLQSNAAIAAAEAAYAELGTDKQAKVENAAVLTAARETYDRIKAVADQIDAIGEVTVESESAITAAEEAYNALTEEEKAKVENYAVLTEARFEANRLSLVGEWTVELYPHDMGISLTLDENGTFLWCAGHCGTWTVSEDGKYIALTGDNLPDFFGEAIPVFEEDGFKKIQIVDSWGPFVLVEDHNTIFEMKYVAVELTAENVREYLGEPVKAGYVLNSWGEEDKTAPAYLLTSQVFDEGLVYVGCSNDFAVELIYEEYIEMTYNDITAKTHIMEPFSLLQANEHAHEGTALESHFRPIRIGDKAKGTLYYVREEYVADNFFDPVTEYTFVKLTNGVIYPTCFQGSVSFDYQDFLR